MDLYEDSDLSPMEEDEIKPPAVIRHRNSSPGVRPRSYFPRRSCDGHFAFLSGDSYSTDRHREHSSRCQLLQQATPLKLQSRQLSPKPIHGKHLPDSQYSNGGHTNPPGRTFRPRVNTLPDALSGIAMPIEREREARSRSQSYTPTPSNGLNYNEHGNRRRRRSQDRILETDSWNNYRKHSIDPRKFSLSGTPDYFLNHQDDSVYRILVLGADKVGKTSLLRQLVREEETRKLDKKDRSVKMLLSMENRDVVIKFDNQRFENELLNNYNSHSKVYYDSVIVIYSIIDRRSFEISAQLLTMTIFDYKRINSDLKVCLIGNKSDLVRARAVEKTEGVSLANRFEVDFFEASIELEDNLENILSWISDNVRVHFGFSTSSSPAHPSHGKFRRALSYMKKVLRTNDRNLNSCESVNAI